MSRALPADRPLTPRQSKIVAHLARHGGADTCAGIAHGIGIHRGPETKRGHHRNMSPAQHILGSIQGLERRGLVAFARRPDGLTGTAYTLTDAGRERAR